MKFILDSKSQLVQQLSEIQTTYIPTVDSEIAALDTRLNDILTEKGTEQGKLQNLETELKQLSENYEQDKIYAAEIKRQIKIGRAHV